MFFFHQFPFTLKWTLLWKKQSISLGIRREKKRRTIYQKRRKRESHEIFQNPTDFFFPFPPTIHQELNGRREGVFFTPQMYQPLSLALRCAYVLVCVCVSSSLPGKFGKGLKKFFFFWRQERFFYTFIDPRVYGKWPFWYHQPQKWTIKD